MANNRTEYVEILEQPAPKAMRFRYECEGRNAGSIIGINSTSDVKTFPRIGIVGYKGPAVVVISCVTDTSPYRPHPYKIVTKTKTEKGIIEMKLNGDNMTLSLEGLGVQCVKKMDLVDSLKKRQELNVDPFRTGFSHALKPNTINLNAVRLCFQVFKMLPGQGPIPLKPIVSDTIYDKKTNADLSIIDISDDNSPACGDKKIMLCCEKVKKGNIAIKLYERNGRNEIVWEKMISSLNENEMIVRKQFTITFWTPEYRFQDINQPVNVYLKLYRPSDQAESLPIKFLYLPNDKNELSMLSVRSMRRKTRRNNDNDDDDCINNLAIIPSDESKDDRNQYEWNIKPENIKQIDIPQQTITPNISPNQYLPNQPLNNYNYQPYETIQYNNYYQNENYCYNGMYATYLPPLLPSSYPNGEQHIHTEHLNGSPINIMDNYIPPNIACDTNRVLVPLPPSYIENPNHNNGNNYYPTNTALNPLNVIELEQNYPIASQNIPINNCTVASKLSAATTLITTTTSTSTSTSTATSAIIHKDKLKCNENDSNVNMNFSFSDYMDVRAPSFNDFNGDISLVLLDGTKPERNICLEKNENNIDENISDSFQNFSLEDNK